jgi:hypothetical protein
MEAILPIYSRYTTSIMVYRPRLIYIHGYLHKLFSSPPPPTSPSSSALLCLLFSVALLYTILHSSTHLLNSSTYIHTSYTLPHTSYTPPITSYTSPHTLHSSTHMLNSSTHTSYTPPHKSYVPRNNLTILHTRCMQYYSPPPVFNPHHIYDFFSFPLPSFVSSVSSSIPLSSSQPPSNPSLFPAPYYTFLQPCTRPLSLFNSFFTSPLLPPLPLPLFYLPLLPTSLQPSL